MSTRPTGSALLGLGWCLITLVLSQMPDPGALPVVLGCLVTAECLSLLLREFVVCAPLRATKMSGDLISLSLALGGWCALCAIVITLFQFDQFALFRDQGFAIFCLLALTLGLILLRLDQGASAAQRYLTDLRWVLAALMLGGSMQVDRPSTEMLLGLCLLCVLVLVLIRLCQGGGPDTRLAPISAGSIPCTYADLLILPLLLGPAEAAIYLIARGGSLVVNLGLSHLGTRTAPALVQSYQAGDPARFVAKAARLNLGFLLIGGGLGLAILTLGPYAIRPIPISGHEFQKVLGWLLIGACAPALFGATDVILRSAGKSAFQGQIGCAAAGGVWAMAFALSANSAVQLAQCFAAIQLMLGGICALYLARVGGIWPGLTALLLRQIKLF